LNRAKSGGVGVWVNAKTRKRPTHYQENPPPSVYMPPPEKRPNTDAYGQMRKSQPSLKDLDPLKEGPPPPPPPPIPWREEKGKRRELTGTTPENVKQTDIHFQCLGSNSTKDLLSRVGATKKKKNEPAKTGHRIWAIKRRKKRPIPHEPFGRS